MVVVGDADGGGGRQFPGEEVVQNFGRQVHNRFGSK
jgi:hypothetical protein